MVTAVIPLTVLALVTTVVGSILAVCFLPWGGEGGPLDDERWLRLGCRRERN